MRKIFLYLITSVVLGAPISFATAQEDAVWVPLASGNDFEGWIQRGGQAHYEISEGVVTGTAVVGTPNSFMCTQRTYSDFELELEFWVDDGLNSGVQIRSDSRPDYRNGIVHGYQVEIDPSERSWSAGIYDEGRAGWLANLENNEKARNAFQHNSWNKLRVLANGRRVQTWINGEPAADYNEATVPEGFIGLQVHSVGQEAAGKQVRWRHIRLRELVDGELVDGE